MTTTPHAAIDTVTARHEIVFSARVATHRITLTARELRDTVASYLARGGRMPTATEGADPIEALHVIVEEWLYGNVTGWINSADVLHLTHYRHHATQWIRGHFGPRMVERDDHPSLPDLNQPTRP